MKYSFFLGRLKKIVLKKTHYITLPHTEIHYVMQVLLSSSTIQNNKTNNHVKPKPNPLIPQKPILLMMNKWQHNQIFNTAANERYTSLAKY